MKTLAVIFVLLTSLAIVRAQDSSRSILQAAATALASHESVSYLAQYGYRTSQEDDTVTGSGAGKLVRETSDARYGGYLRITPDNTTNFAFYDLKNVYQYWPVLNAMRRFAADTSGPFTRENSFKRLIWKEFLIPEEALILDAPGIGLRRMNDSTVDGARCRVVRMRYPDTAERREKTTVLYITRAENIPILIRSQWLKGDDLQSEEFKLFTFRFDSVDKNEFSASQIPETAGPIEAFSTPPMKLEPLLPAGSLAPGLTGSFHPRLDGHDTITFSSGLTLLCFTEAFCPACLKALPALRKCQKKYGNMGLRMYGVDSNDRNGKGLERLKMLLDSHPLPYPILLVSPQTTESYKVNSYPVFYLVDVEGRVVATFDGYYGTLYYELSAKIDELLKR